MFRTFLYMYIPNKNISDRFYKIQRRRNYILPNWLIIKYISSDLLLCNKEKYRTD